MEVGEGAGEVQSKPPSLQTYMDPANSDIHLFFFFFFFGCRPFLKSLFNLLQYFFCFCVLVF